MTNIAPCPNPWCSSHRRDALGSKPFIFPNDSDGGPVRVSCPVCPMEGPMEDSVAEAIEAWNHRVSPSQVAPANPAQVTELHGPFGWLNGHRALSEDSWTLESDPLENSEEYFAIPLYALTDPFKEIGKDFDGTLTAAIGAGGQAAAVKPLEWVDADDVLERQVAEAESRVSALSAEVERLKTDLPLIQTALEHASFALEGIVALDDEDMGKDGGSATAQHTKRTVDRALKAVRASLNGGSDHG